MRTRAIVAVALLVVAFAGVARAGPDRLPGTWLARDATGEVRLVLRGDGTYAWTVRTPRGTTTTEGTYRVEGSVIVAEPRGEAVERVRWAMPADDRLELTDEDGKGLWLARDADADRPAPPPSTTSPGGKLAPGGAPAARAPGVPTVFRTWRLQDPQGLRDPRNGAVLDVLRMAVPSGWPVEGGIRWKIAGKDPRTIDRSDLASPAVVAFRVVAPDRSAWIEVFPEERYTDTSRMPAAPMFPPGSTYAGTTAWPPLDPRQYVEQRLFPTLRAPHVEGARVVAAKASPDLARLYQDEAARLNAFVGVTGVTSTVRAGATTVEYRWNGVAYRETFFVALTYFDMPGTTMWWPRAAWSIAAPADRYDAYLPPLLGCVFSIRFQGLWSLLYLRLVHENARGIAIVDDLVAKIDADIALSRAKTAAQIHADFAPLLMPYRTVKGPNGEEAYAPSGSPVFFNAERGEWSSDPGFDNQPGWTKAEGT
ncbi:MAG: hypothetical protein IT460_02905 [Planctomycetes bacterium]|nr:hypothetical protein [Planctomycetota bacterium]